MSSTSSTIWCAKKLKHYGIKFRPNKPGSHHLNGKLERPQKTDKTEFYPTVNLKPDDIYILISEWQNYYNWDRTHSAHNGKIPIEKYFKLAEQTPFSEDIQNLYNLLTENIQEQNYKVGLQLRKLKRCL